MKKATAIVLSLTLIVTLAVVLSPLTSSISTNPCSQCGHGQYYQYLDIVEVNDQNQIPTMLNVSETKTITVSIQNIVYSPTYFTLTGVSLTLSSQYGHFAVSNPTYNIGDLPPGTITATWQITGTSDGYDHLLIQATAFNPHRSVFFRDNYNPYPLITVGQPTGTPPPPPTPTPPPAPTPTPSTPPPTPTPAPTATPTPTSSPTPPNQTQLTIQMLSPTQGEKWIVGTTHNIEWKTTNGTNPLNITLEYAKANSSGPYTTIASGLPNNSSTTWTASDTALTVYIHVSAKDSGVPPQTASATVMVEVVEAQQELPLMPIALAVVVLMVVIGLAVILFKRRKP